jgi:hypothetical protein
MLAFAREREREREIYMVEIRFSKHCLTYPSYLHHTLDDIDGWDALT